MQEVWERLGVPNKDVLKVVAQAPERDDFQILLFSKIVPNLKKLGLLDAADGWLREKFTEIGRHRLRGLGRHDRGGRRLRRRFAGRAPGGLGRSRAHGHGSAPQEGSARATDSAGRSMARRDRPPRFGAVVTAMVTPFDDQGGLDLDAAVTLARWLADHGSDGLVVAGTHRRGAGAQPTTRRRPCGGRWPRRSPCR